MRVVLFGIKNSDWEDIATGEEEDERFIFIGDIGDNKAKRKKRRIHRIKEPRYSGESEVVIESDSIETMTIAYANGPRDAETLLVDPYSNELVVVSKRDPECFIYSFPFKTGKSVTTLEPIGTVSLTTLTGGDANANGEILIKSYEEVYYWGPSDRPIAPRIMRGPDVRIPYEVEPQGEAICWDAEGNFLTISEHHKFSKQYLYLYERKD